MLHSTGYTRFLLHDLGYPEGRRLQGASRAVLAGTDDGVRKAIRPAGGGEKADGRKGAEGGGVGRSMDLKSFPPVKIFPTGCFKTTWDIITDLEIQPEPDCD